MVGPFEKLRPISLPPKLPTRGPGGSELVDILESEDGVYAFGIGNSRLSRLKLPGKLVGVSLESKSCVHGFAAEDAGHVSCHRFPLDPFQFVEYLGFDGVGLINQRNVLEMLC